MLKLKDFLNLGYYVSELDGFLTSFDRKHPNLSKSQQKERKKYQRIFKLRDAKPKHEQTIKTIWDQF